MIVNYVQTEVLSVSTGAAASSTFTNANHEQILAVVSSSAFHAKVTPTGVTAAATTSDAYFPANVIHYFPIPATGSLSVRGTATTSAWVSQVTVVND